MKKIISINLGEDISGVEEEGWHNKEEYGDLKLLLMFYFLRWMLSITRFLKILFTHILYIFVW